MHWALVAKEIVAYLVQSTAPISFAQERWAQMQKYQRAQASTLLRK